MEHGTVDQMNFRGQSATSLPPAVTVTACSVPNIHHRTTGVHNMRQARGQSHLRGHASYGHLDCKSAFGDDQEKNRVINDIMVGVCPEYFDDRYRMPNAKDCSRSKLAWSTNVGVHLLAV